MSMRSLRVFTGNASSDAAQRPSFFETKAPDIVSNNGMQLKTFFSTRLSHEALAKNLLKHRLPSSVMVCAVVGFEERKAATAFKTP